MSQIETIMLVALGFVVAALLALVGSRVLWSTAVRLGKRRTERSAPATIAALQAERDQLRAEHAMLSRKLELRLEDLKTRLAEQTAEVSRNRNRIDHLVKEVEARDGIVAERDTGLAELKQQMEPLEIELATRTHAIQQLKEQLRDRDEELGDITRQHSELEKQVAERDREIAALRKELEHRPAAAEISSEAKTAQSRLQQQISELTSLSAKIAAQRTEMSIQFDRFAQMREDAAQAPRDDAAAIDRKSNRTNRRKPASDGRKTAAKATSAVNKKKAARKPADGDIDGKVKKIRKQGQSLEQKIIDAERDTDQLQDDLKKLDAVWAEKIAALNAAAVTTVTTRAKNAQDAQSDEPILPSEQQSEVTAQPEAPLNPEVKSGSNAEAEKSGEDATDNGRNRQNVISLAARIRALQRKSTGG